MCPDSAALSAFFDNEVSQETSLRIEEHLSRCPACREILDMFQNQHTLMHSDQDESRMLTLDGFWNFIVTRYLHRYKKPHRIMIPIPLAAAGIVLLLATLAMNILLLTRADNKPLLLISAPPDQTQVSLSMTPADIDMLLTLIEGSQGINEYEIHELPKEIPVARYGEVVFVRPVAFEASP